MEYDVIIVGAGPAGITAAIYCVRKAMNVLVISENIGGQATWSSDIENYPGYQFVTGPELADKFEHHLKKFPITLEDKRVDQIDVLHSGFSVRAGTQTFMAKSLILSPGRHPRFLKVPGEPELRNRGVAYCATCDAPLFKGKDVAVVGGGNSAMDAAIQLIPIANKIFLITDELVADQVLTNKIRTSDKITLFNHSKIREIKGSKFVESIVVETQGKTLDLPVMGVFVEIGSEPVQIPIIGADLKLNKMGEIVVNERCETNIPGLFAAGDATTVPEKQIIVAAGQGSIAALTAFKYVSKLQ